MDWIQQWQSKLNKQNGVAPLVRTGGSRHTGLAALPYRNIQVYFPLYLPELWRDLPFKLPYTLSPDGRSCHDLSGF